MSKISESKDLRTEKPSQDWHFPEKSLPVTSCMPETGFDLKYIHIYILFNYYVYFLFFYFFLLFFFFFLIYLHPLLCNTPRKRRRQNIVEKKKVNEYNTRNKAGKDHKASTKVREENDLKLTKIPTQGMFWKKERKKKNVFSLRIFFFIPVTKFQV